MRYYRKFLLLLTLSLLLPLCGCGRQVTTAEVLDSMCSSQQFLPAGQIYRKDAEPGEAAYADCELLAALYGEGELPPEFEVINDYAIRLCSFAEPHELAVFQCVSARDAYDVAQMCLRRVGRLQVSCRETEHAAMADGAQVSVIGKTVLMAVCTDPLDAIADGRRAAR